MPKSKSRNRKCAVALVRKAWSAKPQSKMRGGPGPQRPPSRPPPSNLLRLTTSSASGAAGVTTVASDVAFTVACTAAAQLHDIVANTVASTVASLAKAPPQLLEMNLHPPLPKAVSTTSSPSPLRLSLPHHLVQSASVFQPLAPAPSTPLEELVSSTPLERPDSSTSLEAHASSTPLEEHTQIIQVEGYLRQPSNPDAAWLEAPPSPPEGHVYVRIRGSVYELAPTPGTPPSPHSFVGIAYDPQFSPPPDGWESSCKRHAEETPEMLSDKHRHTQNAESEEAERDSDESEAQQQRWRNRKTQAAAVHTRTKTRASTATAPLSTFWTSLYKKNRRKRG